MISYIILVIQIIFPLGLSGTISPGKNPVKNTIANKNLYTDYTFTFTPENTVNEGGVLQILFPSQYTPGLGYQNNSDTIIGTCSITCSIIGNLVELYYNNTKILGQIEQIIIIYNILNPQTSGGTGNFILRTIRYGYIIDENRIFAIIGIANEIIPLSSALISADQQAGTYMAGALSKYNFAFKTNYDLPKETMIQLGIPNNGFIISDSPSCQLYPINGLVIPGSLVCTKYNNNINIIGFGSTILQGTEVGISISFTNPPYSIITDKFSVSAYRQQTAVVYSWRNDINGFQVTPGSITEVQLKSVQIRCTLGKINEYILSFLPSNQLPNGAIIKIFFPDSFPLITGTPYDYVHVDSGLYDISDILQLQVKYTSTEITLSQFQSILKPTTITIRFRTKNPQVSGSSSSLIIRTYTDGSLTKVIDENTQDAYVIIQQIASLSPNPVQLSNDMSQGQSTDLTFTIIPGLFVPPNSIVNIYLPNQFTFLSVTAQNCFSTLTIQSVKCSLTDNLVTMINPNTIQYNVGTQSNFLLKNFLLTPFYSGTYIVEIEIISSGIIILSYTDYIIIKPLELTNNPTFLIGQEVSVVGLNKYSILRVQFTTLVALPQGTWIGQTTSLQGRIEIDFGTNHDWDIDLGLGVQDQNSINCQAQAGLLPFNSMSLNCQLIHGKNDQNGNIISVPRIIISGFSSLEAEQTVIIDFPKLKNPQVLSTKLNIMLVQYLNRERTVLNDSPNFFLSLVPQAGAVSGSTSQTLTVSSTNLGGFFNLIFTPGLGFNINEQSYLLIKLPGYDINFIQPDSNIICYLDQQNTPCFTFPGLDWVLIRTEVGQKHYYSLTPYVTIMNLRWPRYVNTAGGKFLQWTLINGEPGATVVELESKTITTDFPIAQPNNFVSATVKAPLKGMGYVGLTFEFNFIANNQIPQGGSVELTFPETDYNLESSFPQTWFEAPQFKGNFIYTISTNVITISNINEHPALTPFTILAHGIRTPSSPKYPTPTFSVRTLYQGMEINIAHNFDQFNYGALFNPGIITFQSIIAFPNNQLLLADYSFDFVIQSELCEGSQILIQFPQIYYPILPSPPLQTTCSISGAATTFYSCTLEGQTYIIMLDQPFYSGQVTITFTNIQNPYQGVTDGFIISTRYDSIFIDITDESVLLNRKLHIAASPNSLLLQQLDFDPRNEGEISTYNFYIIPSSGILSGMQVLIMFPLQYDNKLGLSISCSSSIMISCYVSNRIVYVSGISQYTPSGSSPLVISINGIVNPNIFLTDVKIGQIKISTLYADTQNFIDYNYGIGNLIMNSPPGWAQLYNVLPSNTYSRWQNTNYLFNFTSTLGVPSITDFGVIIVDFPSQFDIPNGDIPCYSVSFTDSLTCNVIQNSVRVSGNTKSEVGAILFNLTQILNPQDQVTSGNMVIKVYNGFSKTISEKSYPNLDPWQFTYTFPGPIIQVNRDLPIIVEAGTFTNDLWFTLDYPCSLNLNFTPISSQFTVSPSKIQMKLGDLQQKFILSAPESTQAGIYYISWLIDGELNQPQYTPLKKTTVQVTKTGNIKIRIPDLWEIPIGGTTTNQLITVDFAPDLGIEILFRPLSQTVYMASKSVLIGSGQRNVTFRAINNQTEYNRQKQLGLDKTDNRQIELYLQGLNKNVYQLTQTILKILIVPSQTNNPFITDLTSTQITQTTTLIQFGAAEISVIYYMIALAGTPSPSAQELLNSGPAPIATTYSRYGQTLIGKDSSSKVQIEGLTAQTPYIIYAIAENRGILYSEIKNTQFQTLDRFLPSIFTMTFTQSYINQADRLKAIQYVAFVLSIPTSQIEEIPATDFRILQQTNSQLSLYLLSNPRTENFPSPYNLIEILNNRIITLKTYLTTLDNTIKITAVESIQNIPNFVESPTIVNQTYSSCTITARLNTIGYIFLVITNVATDTGKPTANQVWWGFNNLNIPHPGGYIKVTQTFTYYNMTINNLNVNSEYNIYLTTGSSQAGYPDLPNNTYVYQVLCQTQSYVSQQQLKLIYGNILSTLIVILQLFMIF